LKNGLLLNARPEMQEDQGEDGERSTDSKTEDQRPTHSLLENLASPLYVNLDKTSS
jgi:hypothetical protein